MDRRIELLILKIETDLSSAWDTTALANIIDLSPSRFRHLFKQETGMSPARYLKKLRMRKAEVLLRTTFLSVKEVLRQAGISSNTHFVSDFKKVHGMTPTAFRRAFGRAARLRQSREKRS